MSQFYLRGRCCRDWPLVPLEKIGRCGYCGETPEVIGVWEDEGYDDE